MFVIIFHSGFFFAHFSALFASSVHFCICSWCMLVCVFRMFSYAAIGDYVFEFDFVYFFFFQADAPLWSNR